MSRGATTRLPGQEIADVGHVFQPGLGDRRASTRRRRLCPASTSTASPWARQPATDRNCARACASWRRNRHCGLRWVAIEGASRGVDAAASCRTVMAPPPRRGTAEPRGARSDRFGAATQGDIARRRDRPDAAGFGRHADRQPADGDQRTLDPPASPVGLLVGRRPVESEGSRRYRPDTRSGPRVGGCSARSSGASRPRLRPTRAPGGPRSRRACRGRGHRRAA